MTFNYANQADILRSYEKDNNFIDILKNLFMESTELFHGHFQQHLHYFNDLVGVLYYLTTSACNLQTLGEEYMGVIRFQNHRTNIPRFKEHLLWIMFYFYGEKMFLNFAKNNMFKSISILKEFLILLKSFHRVIFYFNGDYLHITDRLLSLKYILIRRWPRNKNLMLLFQLMSFFLLFSLIKKLKNMKIEQTLKQNPDLQQIESNESENFCILCSEINLQSASLTCGHIFCWDCLQNLRQTSNQCPICRQFFQPNQIIMLQNYF